MKQIITGTISLNDMHLKELFDLSNVEIIKGDFYCKGNDITNLKGSPHTVSGNFDCSENPLKDIKDIPKYIGRSFYIDKKLKDKFPIDYIRSLSTIVENVWYMDGGVIDFEEWEQAPPGDY